MGMEKDPAETERYEYREKTEKTRCVRGGGGGEIRLPERI